MKHRASAAFWKRYEQLPLSIQRLADKNFALLKQDPSHPSLNFKSIGRFRSARVGRQYRSLAVESGDDLVWFWIGPHDEYERIIRQ